jgi:hypothetical protein
LLDPPHDKVINMEMNNIERGCQLTNMLKLHEMMWKWVNAVLIKAKGARAGGDKAGIGR